MRGNVGMNGAIPKPAKPDMFYQTIQISTGAE